MTQRISVIVPVYADWRSLKQCISSLKRFYKGKHWIDFYLVNDNGPKADFLERKIKKSIKGLSNFYYYKNDENLGFVQNCNNAVFNVVKDKKADVLLLNSDTVVISGAIEELKRILYSQKDIGIVNPRSNNATIWSVPMDARYSRYPRKSLKLWKSLIKQIPEKYISPTAHGFCMLIRRELIDKIGLFDEIYGKGYGEENDLTMRALASGWRCAVANYAFVVHRGSKSFGYKKRKLYSDRNSKILLDRYPNYNSLVHAYIATTKEPYSAHTNTLLLKTTHTLAKAVEYGHYNGYLPMIKKGAVTLKSRYGGSANIGHGPRIHIWSHQISYTGAPMVLIDLLRQWRTVGVPSNIDYHVPNGAYMDGDLVAKLVGEGFNFKESNPISLRFHNGDIVVLNSSAYPKWLYEKILSQLESGTLKHLYIYIHEDDDGTIGSLKSFCKEIREHINKGDITIYAPSVNSTKNWQIFFGVKKGIYSMPGHVSYSEGMFVPKKPEQFNKIDFIVAGSTEPHKGQLSVLYAFINFYNQYYKDNRKKYRDFSLTIAGIKKDSGKYYADFIINAAKSLGDMVKLIYSPNQKQMHDAMEKCNFTITYSIKDSFSIVTVEGMAFGHPIIRSESSGRQEQLDTKNGWAADTSEWEKLVEIIETVLNKDKTKNDKLAKMSARSVEIAKNNYNSKYRFIKDITKTIKL